MVPSQSLYGLSDGAPRLQVAAWRRFTLVVSRLLMPDQLRHIPRVQLGRLRTQAELKRHDGELQKYAVS